MKFHAPFLLKNEIKKELALEDIDDTFADFRGYTENSNGFFILIHLAVRPAKNSPYDFHFLLFQFDKNFDFLDCRNLNPFYDELNSAWANSESGICALPSNELVFSTNYNRTYFFDSNFNKLNKAFNFKIAPGIGRDSFPELNVENPQKIFDNNLFFKSAICPDSNKLMVLIDANAKSIVDQRKMRGDFYAISEKPIFCSSEISKFKLTATLTKYTPEGEEEFVFSKITNGHGINFRKSQWKKVKSLAQIIKEELDEEYTRDLWSSGPIALGQSLFLIPLFGKMGRGGSRGQLIAGLIINSAGQVISRLNDLDFHADSPYEKKHFIFAAIHKKEKIFYKNAYGVYLFDYSGKCIEKHYFSDPKVKSLKPFKLIGSINNSTRIILYHEKNNDLLILDIDEMNSFADSIANSIKIFKKEKSAHKKIYSYYCKCWLEN